MSANEHACARAIRTASRTNVRVKSAFVGAYTMSCLASALSFPPSQPTPGASAAAAHATCCGAANEARMDASAPSRPPAAGDASTQV